MHSGMEKREREKENKKKKGCERKHPLLTT